VGAFGYYDAEKNEFGIRNEVYYAGGDVTMGNLPTEIAYSRKSSGSQQYPAR